MNIPLRQHHLESVDQRSRLRRLGKAAILAFCVKGVISTTLIVAALLKVTGDV